MNAQPLTIGKSSPFDCVCWSIIIFCLRFLVYNVDLIKVVMLVFDFQNLIGLT